MKNLTSLGAILLIAVFTAGTALAQTPGGETYKGKCAMCHGADGSGDTPAGKAMKAASFNSPDLLKRSDADLIAAISAGKGKMPAYKGKLTDAQIKEVVLHIHTLQKK